MNLDHDLRRAFRRTPAPDDLADRVLARIAEGDVRDASATGRLPPSPQSGFGAARKPAPAIEDGGAIGDGGASARRPPASPKLREGGMIRSLAAAAVLALLAAGGAHYYLHRQTVAQAERVQADIKVALQITGEKIALVQRKVEDSQR